MHGLHIVGIGHRAFDIDVDRDDKAVLRDLRDVQLDLAFGELLIAIQLLQFVCDGLLISFHETRRQKTSKSSDAATGQHLAARSFHRPIGHSHLLEPSAASANLVLDVARFPSHVFKHHDIYFFECKAPGMEMSVTGTVR